MKPAIVFCSILFGGFLALWAICALVIQCQEMGL